MNKNKLIILMFVISVVMFFFVLYINSTFVLKKEEIIATLIIGDRAGFDINGTALTFGMIAPGTNSKRDLIIENDYNFPIKFEFNVKGDIEKFLVFDEVVYLKPGENKTVSIYTITPDNEEYGNYSGKMIVVTKRDFFN